jgi:uncharacterized repeat protein (TIGR01451 family)
MRGVTRKSTFVGRQLRVGFAALTTVAMVAGTLAVSSAPVTAVDAPCGTGGVYSESGGVATCTYTATGEDTFTVPAGVTQVTVSAIGAAGGDGLERTPPNAVAGMGGLGASVLATVNVTGIVTLYAEVGSAGSRGPVATAIPCSGGAGGSNGGGAGGEARCFSIGGGGGGGASDVRTTPAATSVLTGVASTDPRLVVAGGGGGGASGNGDQDPSNGGNAGSSAISGAGAGGSMSGINCDIGAGGAGGTGAGGGAAGAVDGSCLHDDEGLGGNGGPGVGGVGGNGDSESTAGPGGGGGGFIGGGGGSAASGVFAGHATGGGAGSSFGPAGATILTTASEPWISISWTVPSQPQTISFTAPATSFVGGGYTPSATATSGLPVTFTLDASSTGCSLSAGLVSFTAVGTCVVNANQAGSAGYDPAPQVQGSTVISLNPQTISSFTAPATGVVGGGYTPSGTASSGLPVTFTLDGTSTGCSLSGGVVSFTAAGTCVVNANQAGNATYAPAPQVQRSTVIGQSSQAVVFTSSAPSEASVGGPTYTPTAVANPGARPATITVDSSSAGVCSISSGVVSFQAPGTCTLNANHAGDATYSAAAQVQHSFSVYDAPSFVQASPPLTASKATPYGYTFQASGTPAPTYSLSGVPAWLSIDSTTGVVSGAPPNGTTFTYSVVATNPAGAATAGPFTVTVTSPPPASTKADLSVSVSCPSSAKVGATTSCKVTVKNSGPATAKNVWVGLALPYSLKLVSTSSGQSWWHNVVTWKTSSLSSRASKTFTVTFKPVFTGRSTLIAGTASSNPDPKWSNNATAKSITIKKK